MNSPKTIRIGTRKSMLAMAQSQMVADDLMRAHAGLNVELVPIVTEGDRYFGPLHTAGGKGLFTAELEAALREGRVDLAVHSSKDLPAAMAADLTIAAVPARADARDGLVTPAGADVMALPQAAVVGTSSLRRGLQILLQRPDVKIVPFRGNVDTRLRKVLDDREVDATVLAMAGLVRSGLTDKYKAHVKPLAVEEFVPASGQGALAIQAAVTNRRAVDLAMALDDVDSRAALEAERTVVAALGGDCHSCLAVHMRRVAGAASQWEALFLAARKDFTSPYRVRLVGESAAAVAADLVERLVRDGVEKLVRE